MRQHVLSRAVRIVGLAAGLAAGAGAEEAAMSVVKPPVTDEILANPGVGWQTFHHTADKDANLPEWIPSTVYYARWGWREVEPEPGRLDTAFLDGELSRARAAGQSLAFRVMCCSTTAGSPYHPSWLTEVGGRELIARYDEKEFPVPDLDDPAVLDAHLDLIRRLGERYDGHPDLAHVDMGSVGWWGEWHMSGGAGTNGMPTLETRRRIVDAYLNAFSKTPLVMLIGGGDMLVRACERGAGWRADCLGDMGGFSKSWCHMRKGYPGWFREAGLDEAWRRGPVAWESCWDMRKWVAEGWPLRYIFNYALALHGSVINNKSAPLPDAPNVRPEIERFLRRLGYRLVLKELEHPAAAARGKALKVRTVWQNTGSAPCYRPYRVAYRLTAGNGDTRILTGELTADRWMPGTVEAFTEAFLAAPPDLPPGPLAEEAETLTVPADLSPGEYELSIAIVAEEEPVPIVQLGIQGRAADGWYPLSRLRVEP